MQELLFIINRLIYFYEVKLSVPYRSIKWTGTRAYFALEQMLELSRNCIRILIMQKKNKYFLFETLILKIIIPLDDIVIYLRKLTSHLIF